ncbi:hypothetical protein GBA52_003681 [Prunus armeniaca]|nr:hypothetical protein GBA52_003681 [Prunus armeniaca]
MHSTVVVKRWWCQARQGFVSHRAMGSVDHASATTTVLSYAGTKASPVADAAAFVAVAFALASVDHWVGID